MAHDEHAEIRRYLIPSERVVADVRWHPVWLLRPSLLALGLLALVGYVAAGLPRDSVLGPVLPFVIAALVLWYLFTYLSWRHERLVVTDRRLLLVRGLVTRRVGVMPLRKVTDLTLDQPFVGRLFDVFGWGTFVFESAGQDQAFRRIPYVPQPAALYLKITEEIFGENGLMGRKRAPDPAE